MRTRRQPSEQFVRRLKAYSEPAVKPSSRIRKFRNSDYWLWAEVGVTVAGLVGLVFIVPTGYALWVDLEDRETHRISQAWELVTRVAPGNAGKGPALEYLSNQGVDLVGIDLSTESNQSPSFLKDVNLPETELRSANLLGANLWNANLSGANLGGANLSGAALRGANLSEADLSEVDLSGATLWEANLSGANLYGANLSGAYLWGADLSGAHLYNADLSGADLLGVMYFNFPIGAKHLDQSQLDTACGDEKTQLPEGFTIKACVEQ